MFSQKEILSDLKYDLTYGSTSGIYDRLMHSVVELKIISDEYFNFNENSYESIFYPKYQDFFNNHGNMQNSTINPNDGSENSVIYNHFDQDSNLDENSYENMVDSSSEDISNNQDNIQNPRLD